MTAHQHEIQASSG